MKIYRLLWACTLFCAVVSSSSAQRARSAKASTTQQDGKISQYPKISEHLISIYNGNFKNINPESPIHINTDLYIIHNGTVRIEASAVRSGAELSGQLKELEATGISAYKRKVNAWIPIKNIPLLQELSSLQYVEVVFRVSPDVGSVDSEADSAMAAGIAKRQYCVDGSGIRIGVLSDTYNANFGAAAGVASGDLPGAGNPNGYTTPVTVVADDFIGIDEGRAMCELIHDLAPAAALYFNSANFGQPAFANAILNLATTHQCDVITDDIRYFEEPFYMDGIIAQACDKVFDMGVPYFASAGNYAQSSYESPFRPTPNGLFHDFDPGPGVDSMQSVSVQAPSGINLTLQWDDPWGTLTPNSPQTDLDLFIYNSTGTTMLIQSNRPNGITLEPTEFIGAQANGGSVVTFNIAIKRNSGPMPTMLKWVIRNANGLVINQFTTPTVNGQSTGYGHSNAQGANAVGACAWFSSPAYGVSPPQPEPFTSSGGVQIRFDTTGTAITPITRNKPNFTATDGVSNTFFNGGSFFGTSAAAPNAAAVAALMLQADPTLTPTEVRNILVNSSLEMSTPGFDFLTGAGLLQADSALAQVYDSLCNISGISVQTPPTFDPGNLTYSVGLRVSFSGVICTDSLLLNGESYDLTGDTFQDVMLTGLLANGLPVDVTAAFDKSVACTLTVTGLFNALSPTPAQVDTLVISEIMYDPPESGADSLEFIEIYNPTASPVNMAGYAFTEGVTYTFGNVVIAAGGYVVVCEDSVALFNQFAVSAYEWGGVNALTNGGEVIVLKDNNGNTVDSLEYDDISPWPTGAGGDGPSIVLCDWTADNNLGASWAESTSGTGIIINGNELKGSPGASDQACLPCTPDAVSIIQFTCDSNQVDTTVVTLTNAGGCDSILTTFTVFDPGSSTSFPDVAICDGDSALIFGQYQSVSGLYFNVLQNANGCDSTLTTQLLVNPTYKIVMPPMNICEGDSMLIFGAYRDTAGTYYDTLQTADGCDSVVCKALVVDSVITTFDTLGICDGDSALIFGNYETVAGNYSNTYASAAGCDSIHTITLQVQPFYSVTLPSMDICQGDSMLVFGIWRDISGVYYDTLQTIGGCDSILSKQLNVRPAYSMSLPPLNICDGDSSMIFGVWQTTTGTYFNTLQTVYGCDSVLAQPLIVNPTYQVVIPAMSICQGDSMLIFGSWQNTAGVYYDTLQAIGGCDSVISKELLVDSIINSSETRTICDGDSSLVFGTYQTVAGVYSDTSQSAGGCDSIHTITLIVQPGYLTTLAPMSICEGDSLLVFGTWQSMTGIYYDSLQASGGCDSVLLKQLIVNPVYVMPMAPMSVCQGDSMLIFGVWQSTAATYYDTLQSTAGCDSILVKQLMVNPTYKVVLPTMNICQGDSMLIFGIYQSAAATYYDTLLTDLGCDSIICKTLIVDSVIFTTETHTICEGDSSLIFGNYETMAGVYSDTSQGAGGCDSIHAIALNVLPAASGATTTAICDGDSILLGGAFQTSGGTYIDTLIAANSCDSVVTTTLIIWPIDSVTVNDSICPGDSLLIGGSYQTAAGSYATILTGSNGCDSVVATILSIRDSLSCPFDTGSSALVCVSDSSWRLSTVVTTATANSYPWPGVPGVPASPTFTLPVDVGQPYPWVHLFTVDSAEVITAESGITYYLKTFELVDPVGIAARFRMFVDDDMQIFVNGHSVALEKDMGAVNYRTANHDLLFNGDGTYTNGNMGGDPFDAVTSADMDTVFKTGTNELVLAIRNRTSKADIGGFSFRMDLDKGALAAKSAPAEVSATAYGIMIYPNPAENYLTVTLENVRDKQPCGITITDLSGKLLSHTEITGKQVKEAVRLDISDYATGLYMMRITAGDKSFTGRFVKK